MHIQSLHLKEIHIHMGELTRQSPKYSAQKNIFQNYIEPCMNQHTDAEFHISVCTCKLTCAEIRII